MKNLPYIFQVYAIVSFIYAIVAIYFFGRRAAQPWQFWMPQSGAPGALMFTAVIFLAAVITAKLIS